MRTIKVTGRGTLSIAPDTMSLGISLTGTDEDYAKAMEQSSQDTRALQEAVAALGFEKTDLKTNSFNIDADYEGYQEDGVWKQRFKGYRYYHNMKLEFPSDSERLGKILYALAQSGTDPECHIAFTVADKESAKELLLACAVKDASAKAEVLAEAAGVTLGDLQNIDYSWGELNFYARPMESPLMAKGMAVNESARDSIDLDINPGDVQLSETVTLVWESR